MSRIILNNQENMETINLIEDLTGKKLNKFQLLAVLKLDEDIYYEIIAGQLTKKSKNKLIKLVEELDI